MTTKPTAQASVRRGFIIVHDILCGGLVPAECDADRQIVLHRTRTEAELELLDATELRADALRLEGTEDDEGDEDRWIEPADLHPDGRLVLPAQYREYSAADLNALWR